MSKSLLLLSALLMTSCNDALLIVSTPRGFAIRNSYVQHSIEFKLTQCEADRLELSNRIPLAATQCVTSEEWRKMRKGENNVNSKISD